MLPHKCKLGDFQRLAPALAPNISLHLGMLPQLWQRSNKKILNCKGLPDEIIANNLSILRKFKKVLVVMPEF
jgi:hypothetical protein